MHRVAISRANTIHFIRTEPLPFHHHRTTVHYVFQGSSVAPVEAGTPIRVNCKSQSSKCLLLHSVLTPPGTPVKFIGTISDCVDAVAKVPTPGTKLYARPIGASPA